MGVMMQTESLYAVQLGFLGGGGGHDSNNGQRAILALLILVFLTRLPTQPFHSIATEATAILAPDR